jgi:hypothetical protein
MAARNGIASDEPITNEARTVIKPLFPSYKVSQKLRCILQLVEDLPACAGGSWKPELTTNWLPPHEVPTNSSFVREQINYGERMLILAVLPKGGAAAKNPECTSPALLTAANVHVTLIQLSVRQ